MLACAVKETLIPKGIQGKNTQSGLALLELGARGGVRYLFVASFLCCVLFFVFCVLCFVFGVLCSVYCVLFVVWYVL